MLGHIKQDFSASQENIGFQNIRPGVHVQALNGNAQGFYQLQHMWQLMNGNSEFGIHMPNRDVSMPPRLDMRINPYPYRIIRVSLSKELQHGNAVDVDGQAQLNGPIVFLHAYVVGRKQNLLRTETRRQPHFRFENGHAIQTCTQSMQESPYMYVVQRFGCKANAQIDLLKGFRQTPVLPAHQGGIVQIQRGAILLCPGQKLLPPQGTDILERIAHLCKTLYRGLSPKTKRNMRIVSIVFNNFLHDSRVLKECISLLKAGYKPEVCALHEDPLPEDETVEGIPVHRIRLKSRSWSKNRLVQVLKYAELWYRFIKRYRKVDVIHCNDVEPLPLAVLTKLLFNRKMRILYDAHELEYDKAEEGSKYYPNFVIRLAERLCLPFTDGMLVVSPLVAQAYAKHYRLNKPPTVVMNCPYLRPQNAPKPDLFRQKFDIRKDQRIFLYQGSLIPRRGLELLLSLFPELPGKYVLVVLGYGPLSSLTKQAEKQNPNIFFHPAVPPAQLDEYTASGDIGFCLYQGSSGNHRLTIGNKIFQYINAGLPVLASSLDGLRYVLREPGLGIVIENFHDKEQLRKALIEIGEWKPENYLPRLRQAALKYHWEKEEKKLLKAYQQLQSSKGLSQ